MAITLAENSSKMSITLDDTKTFGSKPERSFEEIDAVLNQYANGCISTAAMLLAVQLSKFQKEALKIHVQLPPQLSAIVRLSVWDETVNLQHEYATLKSE